MSGDWGVVMLAREAPALVLANLAWHRAMGAGVIHLYLDDPADPVAPLAEALPFVRVIRCDGAFWAGLGGRPGLQTTRQTWVATLAHQRGQTEWLVHLDADEFLHARRPLGVELANLPPDKGRLRFHVRERVFTRPDPTDIFEGAFLPPRPDEVTEFTRDGLVGHSAGKQATRRGQAVELRPHGPFSAAGPVKGHGSTSTVLLHFDGLTPLHWLAKLLRYGDHPEGDWSRFLGPHRQAQVRAALSVAGDWPALKALHDRLKVVPPRDPRMEKIPFDPGPALAALGLKVDRSVAGFDALLRAADPSLPG